MFRTVALALAYLAYGSSQSTAAPSAKTSAPHTPVCSAGAVCFSAEVAQGKEFRRAINGGLDFVLEPQPQGGWNIQVLPRPIESDCKEFAAVVNPPYRYHSALNINESYGISAEDEVSFSPRKFNFVTSCDNYRIESARLEIVLWPYTHSRQRVAQATGGLGTTPLGKGQLWIIASKISHGPNTPNPQLGEIEWMRFTVEVFPFARRPWPR